MLSSFSRKARADCYELISTEKRASSDQPIAGGKPDLAASYLGYSIVKTADVTIFECFGSVAQFKFGMAPRQ